MAEPTEDRLTLDAGSTIRLAFVHSTTGELEYLSPTEVGDRALPVAAIGEEWVRNRMREAGIILGWDAETRRLIVFYGADLWGEFLRRHEREWTPPVIMAFRYRSDPALHELEYFYAAVQSIKGSCCYR